MAAPLGNQNASKQNREWSNAIRRAVKRGKKLNKLAEVLITKVEEGDISAIKEFGDRFEGKIPQAVTGPDGGAIQIEKIERVVVNGSK
jgi:hypothetical protein